MIDMRAFGNLISGANQPGAGYRPGIDPEHAYYNYADLPATQPQDATGGASQPMTPGQMTSSSERGGDGRNPGDRLTATDRLDEVGFKVGPPMSGTAKKVLTAAGLVVPGAGLPALMDKFLGASVVRDPNSPLTQREAIKAARENAGGLRSTMGDIGGSRVDDSGPSGARDEIGSRDGGDRDRGGHQSGSEARGGGDYGEGRYHQGGPVTDQDPSTYRENMEITAQEGEVVMTREAVAMLGVDFFEQINEAAKQGGQPNQAPVPAPQAPPATGLPAFAQMAGGAPV